MRSFIGLVQDLIEHQGCTDYDALMILVDTLDELAEEELKAEILTALYNEFDFGDDED